MRFRVVHKDGTEWTGEEVSKYVLTHSNKLVYCDLLPFLIDEDGLLYLADTCGNYEPADMDMFRVVDDEKLKPCPFCGGEVEHQIMWDGACSFTCSKCGLNARFTDDIARAVPEALEKTERMWNTRYERTCHDISHDSMPVFQCSECGYLLTIRDEEDYTMWHGTFEVLDAPRYCPSCGARVVDE